MLTVINLQLFYQKQDLSRVALLFISNSCSLKKKNVKLCVDYMNGKVNIYFWDVVVWRAGCLLLEGENGFLM